MDNPVAQVSCIADTYWSADLTQKFSQARKLKSIEI